MKKIYVKVRGDFLLDGRFRPFMFKWEDGPTIRIDKILDVRRAASLKAGGIGIRYTCTCSGKTFYLFRDEDTWHFEMA